MKTIVIEYTLSPEADVADVERHIAEFVAGIASLGRGIRYTSHRRRGTDRAYLHVGYFPDEAAADAITAAPFFKPFGEYLRAACSVTPKSTWLDRVSSTEDPHATR
jgi:quinol monooxygenase YgiN